MVATTGAVLLEADSVFALFPVPTAFVLLADAAGWAFAGLFTAGLAAACRGTADAA
jgi:hypothetical protein